jgi:hypothetical protein
MAQAEFREILSVDSQKLLNVVTQYESDTDFVDGCRSVTVLPALQSDLIRVNYQVSVMSQEFTYILDHRHHLDSGQVSWVLV